MQGWRQKWFYIKDVTTGNQSFGLPPFNADATVAKRPSWIAPLTGAEVEEADMLLEKVLKLQTNVGKEVTGIHLLATFIERRVQPLRARVHAMWAYTGVSDPTRSLAEELSASEVKKLVRTLTIQTDDEPCETKSPIAPYEAGNPLPEVTLATILLVAMLRMCMFISVAMSMCRDIECVSRCLHCQRVAQCRIMIHSRLARMMR